MTKVDDAKHSLNHHDKTATINSELVLVDNPVYMASLEKPRKYVNGHTRNGDVNGSSEYIEMNGYSETDNMPLKGKSKNKKEKNQKAVSNPDTLLIENIVKQGLTNGQGRMDSNNSLNLAKDNMYDSDNIMHSAENSFEMNNSGPHREMAIDCPDSFVGTAKVPPVYPPPQTYNSLPHTKHNKNHNAMKNTDSLQNIHKSSTQPSNDQLDRIRRHQEELRKRKEEETKHLKEEEFLRTSLRGSKKLQVLEKRQQPPIGIDNSAFMVADDDSPDGVSPAKIALTDNRYMKKNIGIEELFSSLNHIRSRINTVENKDDITFLRTLFHNSQFQQAVVIHNKVVEVSSRSPPLYAVSGHSQDNVNDVFTLCGDTREPYVVELLTILNKPNIKGLLHAHDEIAGFQADPITEDVLREDALDYPLLQYGEDSVKIIRLEKSNEPLGATVKNEGDSVIIGRIVKGGAAEKSGLLHEGDEIVEVNGIDMRGKNVDDVSEILANMSGTISFMVIPVTQEVIPPSPPQRTPTVHLRALFNYDPEDDMYIPCPELGISFMKGDILHVINQEDPHWWQAYREGEQEQQSLAGLIPSKTFQEQREAAMHVLTPDGKENKKKGKSCACGKKDKKKSKKKKKQSLYSGSGEDTEEYLTYEEVMRYYPQPNRKRPIVLIGPANVGRQELRDRLINSDMDRFSIIVPHTSRPKKADETNGKEYHFISRAIFEQDIQEGKFVEYGEFEKNYYGTTLAAIRRVIHQGKICILNLEPESLKIMRSSDLKPYVISVHPGNLEKLRQIHIKLGKSRTTDDELKQIIDDAREMEEVYGHYFDYVLVNTDMDLAYDELLMEINRIEVEPQWVPQEWVHNFM
ncbi:protein PALS1 isoform X2 [Patella vulgata]|nr:protein PALS1 isoform X2 [Patella vulgata]XP_055957114.1 protein PALS1 isoform X2 [Patella vulgata]XP_055957116.1 protein PALS1 isoform X2 [Patella vulgata]XP_055957117.1 protein PALS1 isoform X2 [Patella vulgata]